MATALPKEKARVAPSSAEKNRLLVHIVDSRASTQPDALYAECPISPTSYDCGFRKVTWSDFANAINGLAWWLHDNLGPGEDSPTLTYFGPNDLRFNALVLGAVKAGYKILLSSPRNSIPAHISLFEALDCEVLLTSNPWPPFVAPIIAAYSLRNLEIPSVDELLNKKYEHFPYEKTFEQARGEPLLAVHTSGTTGIPKVIVWNHDYPSAWISWLKMDPTDGYASQLSLWSGNRFVNTFPPFHAGCFFFGLFNAVWNQTTLIYPPSNAPPSAQLLMDVLKHTKANCAILSPVFIEELSQDPQLLDFIAGNIDSILYAGGPLSQATGDLVSSRMKLFMVIGATEWGLAPQIRTADQWPTKDWNYFRFHPDARIDFQHQSEDLYEAVLKRNPDFEREQPVFKVFPEISEFRTNDLYSHHPSDPDLWTYSGRGDDIIVFLTGEKTNPITMEQQIANLPEVRAALVIG